MKRSLVISVTVIALLIVGLVTAFAEQTGAGGATSVTVACLSNCLSRAKSTPE